MSTLTVPMPDEDLAFLRKYSASQGISAEELMARQASNLRKNLQRTPHSDVSEASGIIALDVVVEEAYGEYLDKKHS